MVDELTFSLPVLEHSFDIAPRHCANKSFSINSKCRMSEEHRATCANRGRLLGSREFCAFCAPLRPIWVRSFLSEIIQRRVVWQRLMEPHRESLREATVL